MGASTEDRSSKAKLWRFTQDAMVRPNITPGLCPIVLQRTARLLALAMVLAAGHVFGWPSQEAQAQQAQQGSQINPDSHFDVEVNLNVGITHRRVASKGAPIEKASRPKKEAPHRGTKTGLPLSLVEDGLGEPTGPVLAPPRNNLKLNFLMSQIRKTNPGRVNAPESLSAGERRDRD